MQDIIVVCVCEKEREGGERRSEREREQCPGYNSCVCVREEGREGGGGGEMSTMLGVN